MNILASYKIVMYKVDEGWRADLFENRDGRYQETDHHAAGKTPQEAAINLAEYWWSLNPERTYEE